MGKAKDNKTKNNGNAKKTTTNNNNNSKKFDQSKSNQKILHKTAAECNAIKQRKNQPKKAQEVKTNLKKVIYKFRWIK